MYSHCLYGRCQAHCVFVLTYSKQFIKTDTRHKSLTTARNKNMSLRSFCVLKIQFLKKEVEHSENERVKQRYQQIKFVKKI